MRLEELLIYIPKFCFDKVPDGIGFLLVEGCLCSLSRQLVYGCKGFCIAEHIAVDGRTRILLFASAADTLLHSVLHIALPVEA